MKKLLIIFAVLCLAAPAMAADWNFYGSSRMSTFYESLDLDVEGEDDIKNTTWAQQGNSRIGARVKVNDQISGRFEYGTDVNLRILYGAYNFGGGQLLVGQYYVPSYTAYGNSVFGGDNALDGIGHFYGSRKDQIRLKFGGFKVALIEPNTVGYTGYRTESTIPKIEAAYNFKADMFFVDVFAGYNAYDLKAASDQDISSYVAGLGGGVTFGPAYLNLHVHMGSNLGNYGAANFEYGDQGEALDDEAAIVDGEVKDNDGLGYMAVLGFNASEMFTIEAGFGYQEAELDVANSEAEEIMQYYLNATINIAPGFFIVPEVGMIQYTPGGDNVPEPELMYFGAKWQINF